MNLISITAGGTFIGTQANEVFDVNTTSDVIISGRGGTDKFIIHPNPQAHIIITDFNITDDVIDLSSFTQSNIDRTFTYSSNSIMFHLPQNQEVIMQNLNDITTSNFIFVDAPLIVPVQTEQLTGGTRSIQNDAGLVVLCVTLGGIAIIGIVVAVMSVLYCKSRHKCGFSVEPFGPAGDVPVHTNEIQDLPGSTSPIELTH